MKKKLLACLTAACAMCTAAALFAGCSEDKNPEKEPEPAPPTETTIEYQFTGSYDELIGNGFDFYFLGNMMSDGSGVIYHAQWFNGNITYTEIELEWNTETDRDGLTTFTASTQSASAGFKDVSIYAEADGSIKWQYTFQFMGGYSRTIDFIGTKKIEYNTVDEWKQFVEKNAGSSGSETPEVPEKDAIVTFSGGEGNSIEFYADGTAKIKAYGGQMTFDYTWTIENGVITMASKEKPSETITSTTKDGVTTIVYTAEFLGGNSLTFTCNDISALEGVAEKEAIVTFSDGKGNSIEFYADGTANIKAYGGQIDFDYRWTVADGVITMTSVDNPSEKITSTTADGVTTIVYTASFLGGNSLTFTCSDISALESAE
ncbi:MAG: hypothetical protein ACLSU0_04170 [Oscillospiraceae bacterium]